MKITNISEGPRGLHSLKGSLVLDPGQEVDVDMAPAEHASSYATGWFDMPAPDDADDGDLNRDELKAKADELGIEYAKNIPTPKLKELVDAELAKQPGNT